LAYCIVLATAPYVLLAVALLVTPLQWTVRHSGNTYLANVGYVTKLKNANCDVVIYGDSAAMVDIDPALIQRDTGLSACNIAEPAGMTMVNGMMIPDLYLQNNSRPKVWIFAFAADNLAPYESWETVQPFEAILFRIRESKTLSTLKLLAAHPKQTFEFAGSGLRLALIGLAKHGLPDSDYEIRSLHGGRYPSPDPPMTACGGERIERPADPKYIADIHNRYRADGTVVIVDTVPKPACDPTLNYYSQHPAPTDNRLEAYPMSDFDNHGHSHMKEPGVARFSASVGRQIMSMLKRPVVLETGSNALEAK
jgi:hypothetical protein